MTIQTSVKRAFNFSAGPAVLPLPVLEQIQEHMIALPGVGSSVLEISHRSTDFGAIIDDARDRIKSLLAIPDTHEVLFLQGGGRFQNTMIPMNFLSDTGQTADYIVTGAWGKKSSDEVRDFGKLNIAWSGSDDNFNRVPEASEIKFSENAAYLHYTSNETIQGVQFQSLPQTDAPLVVDCSSDFMCGPLDVSKFGMIYACAQKNAGTAGVTIVVIDKQLAERATGRNLPGYLDFTNHIKGGSMYNTPPTFAIYVTGLVCKWLQEEIGSLAEMEKINRAKAAKLYDLIDGSGGFYTGHAKTSDRSIMNVVFKLSSDELDAKFIAEAAKHSLTTLKGHRSLGGIRASIYNSMPVEGVDALAEFMKDFAQQNG